MFDIQSLALSADLEYRIWLMFLFLVVASTYSA